MNSFRKILIKTEICGNFISSIACEEAQHTIEWMKEELDNAIVNCVKQASVKDPAKEVKLASKFIDDNRESIKGMVPEPIPALFLVSVITHFISDLENTKFYKHFDTFLDACLKLEEYAEKDDIELRRIACGFTDKIESMMES